MASDLTGVDRVRSAPATPSAPPRPADSSRALVPVRPASSGGSDAARTDVPLGRSGVSLLDLLATADLLVARDPIAAVALDMALESARGALLRQQPGTALDALDAVWDQAAANEEGWYLRSGALLVMGLANEADRVASGGLDRAPASLALRFVLSLARTALGDIAGARAALAPALEAAPAEPILLAQQAALLARQERGSAADSLLAALRAAVPEHPALRWAQDEIRKLRGDAMRDRAMPGRAMSGRAMGDSAVFEASRRDATVDADLAPPISDDLCDEAFARFGVRLSIAGSVDAIAEARTLLRALSSGGALAAACLPEQAHGARTLLASIVGALRGDTRGDARGEAVVVPPVVRQLVTAVRGGRLAESERTLQRELRTLPYPQRRWVDALLRDLRPAVTPRPTPRSVSVDQLVEQGAAERVVERAVGRVVGRVVDAALTGEIFGEGAVPSGERREENAGVPVRLGLGLLSDSAAARQAARASGELTVIDPMTGERYVPFDDGRGAAALMSMTITPVTSSSTLDLGVILPPILALAVAVAAALNGATLVAVTAMMAMLWLALRRRTISIEPFRGTAAMHRHDSDAGID